MVTASGILGASPDAVGVVVPRSVCVTMTLVTVVCVKLVVAWQSSPGLASRRALAILRLPLFITLKWPQSLSHSQDTGTGATSL